MQRSKLFMVMVLLTSVWSTYAASEYPHFDGAQDAKSRGVMERAEQGIEKYRKGDFEIKLIDEKSGRPISQEVKIELKSHLFDFGVNLFQVETLSGRMRKAAHETVKDIFNMVVVCDYFSKWWYGLTNSVNKEYIFYPAQRDMEFAEANDTRMRFHAVWYNLPSSMESHAWSEDRIWAMLEDRIKYVAQNYGDRVDEYDVINEIIFIQAKFYNSNPNYPNFADPQQAKRAFELARRYLPTQKLVALESGIATVKDGNWFAQALQQHRNMIAAGVDFDYVGYQGHFYYKHLDYRDGHVDLGADCFTMGAISDGLDLLGELGKPVVITEFNGPSRSTSSRKGGKNDKDDSNDDSDPLWSLSDDENADWQINFYRLAFSKPYIRQITRWFMVDELAGRGIDAGMLDKGGNKHAIYDKLRRLIKEEWHTLYSGESSGGEVSFRGFYGLYNVNVDGYKPSEVELNSAGEYKVVMRR